MKKPIPDSSQVSHNNYFYPYYLIEIIYFNSIRWTNKEKILFWASTTSTTVCDFTLI